MSCFLFIIQRPGFGFVWRVFVVSLITVIKKCAQAFLKLFSRASRYCVFVALKREAAFLCTITVNGLRYFGSDRKSLKYTHLFFRLPLLVAFLLQNRELNFFTQCFGIVMQRGKPDILRMVSKFRVKAFPFCYSAFAQWLFLHASLALRFAACLRLAPPASA